jgi:amino acid transporter
MTFVARVGTRLDDLHSQLHPDSIPLDASTQPAKLGTFEGVFLPVMLSIWGVVVFVRLGFIVAHAGVLGAAALWTTGYLICLLTAMSLSAIATNGRVRGETGAYTHDIH